jgi:hypothetical protein
MVHSIIMDEWTAKRRTGDGASPGPYRRASTILLLLFGMIAGQTDLLVCLPGKQNTQLLQNCFDSLLGPSHAMVFGRIKDLEATIPKWPQASIIALGPLFDYLSEYKPVLIGKNRKMSGEKFLIIAASKEITTENIADKKVGIIDMFCKSHLPLFIKEQFNIDIKLLKKVNKEDDLLTMLGLEAVDAIIVSSEQYKEILSNTKLPITIVATSKNNVGFAQCAAKEGKMDAALKKALLKSPQTLLRELCVDSWEVSSQ